ncbi:hypothetical protein RHMOL_Rhmol02G0312600 [Rhododendron molle]|uniref:Uncharacterized protein n=1 Tax=Rhododendron molle TaxID=49168 RepID=A0ACC0PWP2_RHOML|nr:hypothetical protein RHMOL_Rhmol02G0312600 [Rhododendron molle]
MSSRLIDTPQEKLRLGFNLGMTNISALLFKIGETFLTEGLAKLSRFAHLKHRSKSFYITPPQTPPLASHLPPQSPSLLNTTTTPNQLNSPSLGNDFLYRLAFSACHFKNHNSIVENIGSLSCFPILKIRWTAGAKYPMVLAVTVDTRLSCHDPST